MKAMFAFSGVPSRALLVNPPLQSAMFCSRCTTWWAVSARESFATLISQRAWRPSNAVASQPSLPAFTAGNRRESRADDKCWTLSWVLAQELRRTPFSVYPLFTKHREKDPHCAKVFVLHRLQQDMTLCARVDLVKSAYRAVTLKACPKPLCLK